MIRSDQMVTEIRRLVLREGWNIEATARYFGCHHSVIRRALREDNLEKKTVPSALDPYKSYIVERLSEFPRLSGIRLHDELKARGYQGGIAILRRYVAKVRPPRPRKAYFTIETEPGEQAQVDWGSFGRFRIGSTYRLLSVFAMVLSWSRAIYIDFSFDQKMDTFLRMHRRALEYFEGVPKRILYDNLKSVVLHHVGQTVQFNPQFLRFAGHYLFEPVATPIRYPQAKGKVESCIRYIRHSFFYGRTFSSINDLRAKAAMWRDNTANYRIHASTRERPCERLLIEKLRLHGLPERPYDTDLVVFPLVVPKEARLRLDTNSYSVPPQYVGRTVSLRADDHMVHVICNGEEIASHARCYERRKVVENKKHVEQLLVSRKGARGPKSKEHLAAMAPECRIYLQEVARRNINLGNEVKKLMRMVESYGETEVAGGMAEALKQRTFGAHYVRALIDQARFKRGLGEPPEPIVTGNPAADKISVEPHALETYDAIIQKRQSIRPQTEGPEDTDTQPGSRTHNVSQTSPGGARAGQGCRPAGISDTEGDRKE